MENKRARSVNFTKNEVRELLEIVSKYSHILENKKTDAVVNSQKEDAWKAVTDTFNATSSVMVRSVKTIRMKYDSLKKAARRASASYVILVLMTSPSISAPTEPHYIVFIRAGLSIVVQSGGVVIG